MSSVTTTQWQGPRAQAWRTIHEAQPGKWSQAAAGFRSAALAMTRHASSIDEARGIAARASSLWKEGEQAEQKQKAAEATDPTLALVHQYQGSTDAAGTGLKARAVSTLVEAMDLVDTSGRTSAGLVRTATQAAPTSQESTFELFHDLGEGYDGVTFHDVTTRARDELGVGMVGGLVGLGELVWRTTQHQAPMDRLKQTGLESYYRWTGKTIGVDGTEGVTKAGEFISPMLIPVPALGIGADAAALAGQGSRAATRTLSQFTRVETPEIYAKGSLAEGAVRARGWTLGDPIDNLTRLGREPSWSAVRARYWKNEALNAVEDEFSPENLARMRKGDPPREDETGASMELNHIIPRHKGGKHTYDNLEKVWPWEHDVRDEYRHYTGPVPSDWVGASN